MALFESYERRIEQIKPVMDKYEIESFEDARNICLEKGFDPYKIVKDIQPTCIFKAYWLNIFYYFIWIKSFF